MNNKPAWQMLEHWAMERIKGLKLIKQPGLELLFWIILILRIWSRRKWTGVRKFMRFPKNKSEGSYA